MKKLNITSKGLATIALTCVVWLCVLIAAAFALDEYGNIYTNGLCAIGYLLFACLFEWVKYKITHQKM